MNYEKIYNQIIEKAKSENRCKNQIVYYESHHIIPKCMGGDNKKENLILLTAREHYICHYLLMKIHKNNDKLYQKMCRAFWMMQSKNKKHKRYDNSRLFDYAKNKLYGKNGILSGKNSTFYGKKHSEETKEKTRQRQLKNNPMKGQKAWNNGLTKETSEKVLQYTENMKETKKLNPQIRTEKGKEVSRQFCKLKFTGIPKSESHKEKLRQVNLGKITPDNVKQKIRDAKKGIPKEKVQCPHCSKIGGKGVMGKWHFDRCKEKKVE